MIDKNVQVDIYHSVLHKDENWVTRRTLIKKKTEASKGLGPIGNIHSIHYLLPYLLHSNEDLRHASITSIIQIFATIEIRTGNSSTLRHCNILKADLKKYTEYYSGENLDICLAIASLNGNGYVREHALHLLNNTDTLSVSIVPFIVYRLGDWVNQVRNVANLLYRKILSRNDIDLILNNLDSIHWLNKVKRIDLSNIYQDTIYSFLLKENLDHTLEKFSSLSEKHRFLLASEFLNFNFSDDRIVDLLINDRSYLVRSKIAERIIAKELSDDNILKLQTDKSALVRHKTLQARLDNSTQIKKIHFEKFLTDKSGSIRNIARFHLKSKNIDYAEFYISSLSDPTKTEASIYAMGELGIKSKVSEISNFLVSENLKFKRAAIRTTYKLEPNSIIHYLQDLLDSKYMSLRKLSIKYLSKHPSKEVLTRARRLYKTGDVKQKISMLTLFQSITSYQVLPDLIVAIDDNSKDVRNLAWSYLLRWKRLSTSFYTNPSPENQERARLVYDAIQISNSLPKHKKKFWEELPYYGRFEK